jgi:hypothetical protein
MWFRGRGTIAAETNDVLAAYQVERPADTGLAPGLAARIVALKGGLANLWPVTMIALALGLTVAWTGLLMSLVWWGIEELI